MTLLQYLSRVVLYLLAFATVAAFTHWCVGMIGSANDGSAADRDVRDDER